MSYKKIPGIYKIECLQTGKVYVGSAVSIKARWASHRSDLRGNRHPNKHLQNAWNKYGEQSFAFSVIEECEIEQLIDREQHWIDSLNACSPEFGMNNSPTASTTIGFRHSSETKEKLSKIASERDHTRLRELASAMRGKPGHGKGNPGKKWTDEQRAAASAARRGRTPWNKGVPMPDYVRRKVSDTLQEHGRNRVLGNEIRSEVCRLRAAGMTLQKISEQTGVSVAHAYRISKHIEVSPRRGLRTAEKINVVAAK